MLKSTAKCRFFFPSGKKHPHPESFLFFATLYWIKYVHICRGHLTNITDSFPAWKIMTVSGERNENGHRAKAVG
jgi:hypothetical protein